MRTNAMSSFGRMTWGMHMLLYPGLFAGYKFLWQPYSAENARKAEQKEWDDLTPAKAVDPDLFSPFTPVPFHNNPELKYVYHGIKMKDYVNENHINTQDYVWKNFHHSFDHEGKKTHTFNWTSN